jgi:hypothetical protein
MEQAITFAMRILQYLTLAYTTLRAAWNAHYYPVLDTIRPHRRYFLSDARPVEPFPLVPAGAIYVEEWVDNGNKRCVLRYTGEVIPTEWTESPFDRNAKTPWIWVGDRETEIDLTRTFNRFLVVGNHITNELVEKLITVNDRTNLIYIESGTFKELKFPGDGLVIEEYEDGVPNRG